MKIFFLCLWVGLFSFYVYASDRLYLQAEQAFVNNDPDKAQTLLLQLLSPANRNVTSKKTLARAYNLRGVILFQKNRINSSLPLFQKAVEIATMNFDAYSTDLHLAKYNLAKTYCRMQKQDLCRGTLDEIEPRSLDPFTKIRFYLLVGSSADESQEYLKSTVAYIIATSLLSRKDSIRAESTLRKSYEISEKMFLFPKESDLDVLDSLQSKIDNEPYSQWTLKFIIAKGNLTLGNRDRAKNSLQEIVLNAGNHPLRSEADILLRQLEKLSAFNRTKVGVLLPLSGRYSKYGRLSLNAITLAFNHHLQKTSPELSSQFQLVVQDSGVTEKTALSAFSHLVFTENVAAVVGPLLRKQAKVIGQKAQEYGVPLFSLSQRNEMSRLGSFIFAIGLTPAQQVKSLVQHAMEKQNMTRFAILAPESQSGKEYVDLFWSEVEAAGGSITGIETYPNQTTDFRDEIKRLTGLYYLGARKMEIEELERRRDIYAATIRARGNLRKRLLSAYNPKALIDFHAIFVPDGPVTIGQIAPTFAIHSANNLTFLGMNTWNTKETIKRAGKYLQNSVFVDAFYPESERQNVKQFIREFSEIYFSVPGTLEAQAYDATRILLLALSRKDISNRLELRNSVISLGTYSGVTSTFTFSATGIQRQPFLLGIRGDDIVTLSSN